MKKLLCLLLALCMFMPCALAEEEPSELDEGFAKIFKRYKAVGACVLVAKDGEIVYEMYHGYAHKTGRDEVTENTYFRIASVTKMVSAVRVMQLVEQGVLALDADISDYYGYSIRNPRYKDTPITLRMLMSHTSSITPTGSYGKPSATMQAMLDVKNRKTANYDKFKPGSKYKYSNFGAGIMGSLIEVTTGENFDLSIRQNVFEPLGIQASYYVPNLPYPERAASAYGPDGKLKVNRNVLIEETPDDTVDPDKHFRETAGSLWITGRDLCRIGMMLCNGGSLDGVTILQPETVEMMKAEQQGQGGVTGETPYGLCVHRVHNLIKGRMFYGHQGLSNGILANVYFDPETQFVFVMISNGCNNKMDDRIGIMSRQAFRLAWNTFGDGTQIK